MSRRTLKPPGSGAKREKRLLRNRKLALTLDGNYHAQVEEVLPDTLRLLQSADALMSALR
jgi:hypothetical protein